MPDTPSGKITRRQYQRLPEPVRQRLQQSAVTAYAQGDSIRAIAAAIGYGYATVHRILTDAGVLLRGRGGAHPRRDNRRVPADAARQRASR